VPGSLVGVTVATEERLQMTSPTAAASTSSPISRRFIDVVRVFVAGPYLDAELADGIRARGSRQLTLRARHITKPRARRKLARALLSAIEASREPILPLSPRIPVDSAAVLACREEITALAESIEAIGQPSARAVAIARQLAYDGGSPLYWHPMQSPKDRTARLTNTIHAARAALDVSPEFDAG
jgi:hypothetical protein